MSFFRYVLLNRAELLTSTVEHIGLVAVSSGLAILIGVYKSGAWYLFRVLVDGDQIGD